MQTIVLSPTLFFFVFVFQGAKKPTRTSLTQNWTHHFILTYFVLSYKIQLLLLTTWRYRYVLGEWKWNFLLKSEGILVKLRNYSSYHYIHQSTAKMSCFVTYLAQQAVHMSFFWKQKTLEIDIFLRRTELWGNVFHFSSCTSSKVFIIWIIFMHIMAIS